MRNFISAAGLLSALLLTTAIGINAQSAGAGHQPVTICHRTGAATNPYVVITIDAEGVVNGHIDHTQIGNGEGPDIIPVFRYKGATYSQNLGTSVDGVSGSAILANGCVIPEPTPSPTPRPSGTPPPAPVPEPMTLILLATGLAGVGFAGRKFFTS